MRTRTLTITAAGALVAALALTGCAQTGMPGHDMGDGPAGMHGTTASPDASFNDADVMFVTMMIPHHEQAVQMADLVLAADGVDERVRALAEQIKAAQSPEIVLMRDWLASWGVADATAPGAMSGMGHGDGMMTDGDLDALENATGAEATRRFLEGMIAHHDGAVAMAESVLEDGRNPEVADLARQIIDGQTAEITTMRDLLATN